MPTTKERILVTLTPDMAREIKAIAKREKSPKATIAARLMRQALEDIEDRYIARVADARLAETKKWIPGESFWKQAAEKRNG